MFKQTKLYSFLSIIVISTLVGLFGFSAPVLAAPDRKDAPENSFCGGNIIPIVDGYENGVINTSGKFFLASNDAAWDVFFAEQSLVRDETGADSLVYLCSIGPALTKNEANEYGASGYLEVVYFDAATDDDTINAFFDGDDGFPVNTDKVLLYRLCGNASDDGRIDIESFKLCSGTPGQLTEEEIVDGGIGIPPPVEEVAEVAAPSSCQIKGIGWFVCPVVIFLAEITDASYTLLDKTLLRLEPIALPGAGNSDNIELYDSWKAMRDFANIMFIIGFLIIVFSQITSIGIGNYGIKRLLPKIIIAAILVNLSYYICVIGVDLSNIIGNNLRDLFSATPNSSTGGGPFSGNFDVDDGDDNKIPVDSWQDLIYLIIGGAGAGVALVGTGALLYAALPVLLPMIIGAAVAVFTVVVALTIRQALIVILVVISPLAFVALLLPNTEGYFKKWRSLFMAMLLVYPIISVVFGASALASRILMATDDFPVQIVGAGVSIIPLFITPIIMKASGGLLNRFVGVVNDPSKGWVDGKRNALSDQGKIIAAGRKAGGIARTGNLVSGTGARRLLGGANSRRRRAVAFGTAYGEKTRKDNLETAETGVESAYLGTEGGRTARGNAKNAQQGLQTAQINAETIRLSSAEGISLQVQATRAETEKHASETEAQTAAIRAIPHALEERAILADTNKKTAENDGKGRALDSLAMTTVGQAALARAEDAKNTNAAAEKSASTVGLAGANRAIAASAENATLGEKIEQDNLAREVAPLVSQTVRVMAKGADITKQEAVSQAETAATTTFNSSLAGRDALGSLKDAELQKTVADNDSKGIGIARANQEFKIQAETSTQDLSTLQNQDKQLYEEISARGTTDLANFDPAAHGVSHTAANAARTSRLDSNAVNSAVSTAQNEGSTEYAKAVQTSAGAAAGTPAAALIERASGNVNPSAGRERAVGRATAIINKNTVEALDNELDTMSEASPTGAWTDVSGATRDGLDTIMAEPGHSVERRAAAIIKRIEVGGDKDVRDSFEYLGREPLTPEVAAIQQLVMSRVKRIPKILSQSQQAAAKRGGFRIEQFDTGTGKYIPGSIGTMTDLARNRVSTNSMSPETMASMPEEDLEHMFTSIDGSPLVGSTELKNLQSDILAYLTSPDNAGSLPARKITNQMENIMNIK